MKSILSVKAFRKRTFSYCAVLAGKKRSIGAVWGQAGCSTVSQQFPALANEHFGNTASPEQIVVFFIFYSFSRRNMEESDDKFDHSLTCEQFTLRDVDWRDGRLIGKMNTSK